MYFYIFLEFQYLYFCQAYVRELPSVTSIQLVGEEQLEGVSLEENNYLEVNCSQLTAVRCSFWAYLLVLALYSFIIFPAQPFYTR